MIGAKGITLILLATVAMTSSAVAAPTRCSLWAHITDPDTQGTNVRAAPTSKSRALVRLKKAGKRPPVVRVTGQRGAWFRISKAEVAGRTAYKGAGWIHRSLLAVQLRGGAKMYAGPSRRTKQVSSTGDVEADGKLLACRGGWAKIRHSESGKRGWLPASDHCPDMGTTCS